MTAHDEALRAAAEEFDYALLQADNCLSHHEAAKAIINRYLAAMLERGWKMTPREPTEPQRLAIHQKIETTHQSIRAHFAWREGWDEAPKATP